MPSPVIQVENLCKDYVISHQGGVAQYQTLRDSIAGWFKNQRSEIRGQRSEIFHALKDVSFEVKQGEVLGVIGRNGAGKSTLLKILSRITEPSSGRIRLKGRVASLLEVGTGFHPELTGRENIFLNGTILGMQRSEIRKKFDEIVAFSEVEKFLDTPVKHYSSGMYVRLAFAVAAHLEPEILIVDEVLAVGDMAFQKKCIGKIQDVSTRSGRTVIFVSHNMETIGSLCSRGFLFEQGKLKFSGEVAEAIRLYGDSGTQAGRNWTGPFVDENITLEETWVNPHMANAALDSGNALEIGLRIQVHRPILGLILGYQLVSEFGGELVYCLHDDSADSPEELSPGRYIKRFIIPANMLSAGFYRIIFDIGVHNIRRIIQSPIGDLEFELLNATGIGRHYIIGGRTRGHKSLLRPNWPVETEHLP